MRHTIAWRAHTRLARDARLADDAHHRLVRVSDQRLSLCLAHSTACPPPALREHRAAPSTAAPSTSPTLARLARRRAAQSAGARS